jgi:glutamate transport system substrate-binding protein
MMPFQSVSLRSLGRSARRRIVSAVLALVCVAGSVMASACGNEDVQVTGPRIRIGVKFDQPGLSVDDGGQFSGFDIDVARYVANKLGYSPSQIQFKEAPSAQREALLQNGSVNMVIGTYSITQDRKSVVDFAGPYFVAGQDLLIRKSDRSKITGPRSLAGRKVCSVSGSTSATTVKKYFPRSVQLMELSGYAECVTALVSGAVDAVTTDDIILATLASAKGDHSLMVVGHPFTKETYGIGVRKDSPHLVAKINEALREMIASGEWKRDLDAATKGTGFTPNKKWNPPTRMDAAVSDERVRF